MTKIEFNAGFERLLRAFATGAKENTAAMYYDRFADYSGDVWREAVAKAIDTEQHFPRISAMLKHIGEAAEARRRREWGATKRREREQAARTMADRSDGGWIKDTVTALCLPTPEERLAALAVIVEVATDNASLTDCDCLDGMVYWLDGDGNSFAGACTACGAGRDQPRAYPRVDPATLEMRP